MSDAAVVALPTVAGLDLTPGAGTRVDAHAHAWIDPPEGVPPEAALPLRDEAFQSAELRRLALAAAPRRAALVDCQPPACGRDARALARLSNSSGVSISAVTGFHLARYYPGGIRPWRDAASAADCFVRELHQGMAELPDRRAGLIKAAHTGRRGDDPAMWEAVVAARAATDALLLVHTERGAGVEDLVSDVLDLGVPAAKLYLCHVDKRPDHGLLRDLARAGVLLGFDTIVRPKYRPETTTWPLLQRLVQEDGLAPAIALGLDLAEAAMWRGGTINGPAALVHHVEAELGHRDFDARTIDALLGENLLDRAARSTTRPSMSPTTPPTR